jgi:tetratricopeptide (TPR) repeat protein
MNSAQRPIALLFLALLLYGVLLGPFTSYMKTKPIEEKLGYVPSENVLRYLCADQKPFVGAALLMKVIMYFGGITDKQLTRAVSSQPDYRGMSNIIHSALRLDPYNMDGYYFAQSFLTWEVKQFGLANRLLEYGMRYRTWDWYLPFFTGFNYAYFLKDYPKAAEYYKRAGDLSGQELHISLSSRYMQESGQTDLAIAYLKAMISSSRNETAKKLFEIRLEAFETVRTIEKARDDYKAKYGRLPITLDNLVSSGHLAAMPKDPYGGTFYLEPDGKVASTSKFAFGGKSK